MYSLNEWAVLSDSGLDYHACMSTHCMPGAMYPLANFPDTPRRSRLLGGYQVHDHAEVTPLAQTKLQLPSACPQTLWCTLLSVPLSLQPTGTPLRQSSHTYCSGPISFFRVSPPAKGICPNLQPVQARTKDGSYHFHTAVPGIWACGAPPIFIEKAELSWRFGDCLGGAWCGYYPTLSHSPAPEKSLGLPLPPLLQPFTLNYLTPHQQPAEGPQLGRE